LEGRSEHDQQIADGWKGGGGLLYFWEGTWIYANQPNDQCHIQHPISVWRIRSDPSGNQQMKAKNEGSRQLKQKEELREFI
jgi:hypothetical protein